ncbi:MAG TPA: phosphate regulon sensor histidine kinase PhoR [Gammaproteobacteria bacterium]|nr:phosphate regulon sensor histidine kinase PhoR [Gammaproteobacteria bacterium]
MTKSVQNNQQLPDLLPIPLIFLDHELRIQSWNLAAKNLLNLNAKKHFQQPINTIFNKVNFEKLARQKSHPTIETAPLYHPDMDLSLSLVAWQDNQYLLIMRDVTQLHHLERIRQDFVANVSHELRTPLTVVHGYLEMLLDEDDRKLQPYKKMLEQMYQQSLRMQKLIEDLLLLSRLESEVTENERFKTVAVANLLKAITIDAKALSGSHLHHIKLIADHKLKIDGLENELRSAFSNLIFNAVNYTPARGHITIHWYKEGNNACLSVTDTGIGIKAEHIPRLTERFYRVDKARSRSSGGTGLGLAIVKHVLLLHKANLKILSEPGKGSTFICIFPVKTE